MKVLSLFDGISCGRIAFERAGIHVSEYHACEIDKYAIKVSQRNYPDIVWHGSVTEYHPDRAFDYVIGGSPCQGFSFAGGGNWRLMILVQNCFSNMPEYWTSAAPLTRTSSSC